MPDTRTYPCLLCPDVSESSYWFSQHLAREHDTKPTDVYGTACPVCLSQFEAHHSLGVHINRSHPEHGSTTSQVFRKVLADGDAHGVVTARLKLFPQDPNTVVRSSPRKKAAS